jgi:starch-binding outer membrane protein, SusD/RagB family
MKEKINYMKILIAIPVITIIMLIISACSIDDSLNNSPNAINEESVKSLDGIYGLLIGLQVTAADVYSNDRSRINSMWTWQAGAVPGIARPQPVEWNSYIMSRDGPTNDFWLYGYRGVKQASDIIEYAPGINNFGVNNTQIQNTVIAIAKTYKAIFLGEFAACYGSIPINIKGFEPPGFVSQQAAYNYVQELLSGALQNLATAESDPLKKASPLSRDLNFGGDAVKWIKVINSLKARYYLHVKDYSNALTSANLGIDNQDQNLYGIFSDNAGENAHWGYWVLDEGEPIRADKFFIDVIQSESGDGRLAKYFRPGDSAAGRYLGYAIHSDENYKPHPFVPNMVAPIANERKVDFTCRMVKYSGYSEPFPYISYHETVLIKAECKARAGDLPGAAADVNIVRTAAGLSNYSPGSQAETIIQVLKQKYIELYLEGQAYHDMRRTGLLPEIITWKQSNGNKTNLRWIYCEDELNANLNVPPDADNLVDWILDDSYKGQ